MAFTNRNLTLVGDRLRPRFNGGQPTTASSVKGARSVDFSSSGSTGRAETANMSMMPGGFATDIQSVGYFGVGQQFRTFDTMLPENSEETLIPFYRDMYYYDAIGGSACDLMATFAFSDWQLSGIEADRAAVYSEGLARLNMRTLLPELALHYLVDGDFIGTLIYNKDIKNFSDILVHDRLYCRVVPSPFYAMDPIIQAQRSAKLGVFANSGFKHADELLRDYPKHLVDALATGGVELDPLTTLHVARRALADRMNGSVSYLKRMLPLYMLEKVLYRGTLIEFNKRQRATTHVQMGDDTWEPTIAEMEAMLQQFQSTEMDPLGAWIVTRNAVNVSDIRQGGDFAKWTDYAEQLTPLKLRALSISEAFLAGDASYSNADSAVTVFMENADAFRNFLTFKVFNYKIFPLIALANGFYKEGATPKKGSSLRDIMFNANNQKDLDIPKLIWNKDLTRPDGQSRMDMLNTLSEKGMPVALRTWVAAAGFDLGSLLGDLQEESDESFVKVLNEYRKANNAIRGTEGEEEGGGGGMFASFKGVRTRPKPLRRLGLANRDYGDPQVATRTKTGKRKAVLNEHAHMRKENEQLVAAALRLESPDYRKMVRDRLKSKFGGVPNIWQGQGRGATL